MCHSGIGGFLGWNLINHLCYADDLCLIALSLSGMQCLLEICDKYATGHQLTYNATQSFTLCFKLKHIKIGLPDFVLGKLVIPAVDECKYRNQDFPIMFCVFFQVLVPYDLCILPGTYSLAKV